jgi:mono/diheme cytochrome c family protein
MGARKLVGRNTYIGVGKCLALLCLIFPTVICVADEVDPTEYQPSVNIQKLLGETPTAAQTVDTSGRPLHFADATSADSVRAGLKLYKAYCSSCHGRQLQGQALWQARDQYDGLRAPAHDDTGHTWQHSDEDLFVKVRNGRMRQASSIDANSASDTRHVFSNFLSDENILQILSYIKARWSLGGRVAQSTLNPGFTGMPTDAFTVEWTFPPTCLSSR